MARRLTAFDIAQAGSMELLVQQTVEQVKYGNMETKAFGSSVLRSLTEMHAWSAEIPESSGGQPWRYSPTIEETMACKQDGTTAQWGFACLFDLESDPRETKNLLLPGSNSGAAVEFLFACVVIGFFVRKLLTHMCANAENQRDKKGGNEASRSMSTALKLGDSMWGITEERWHTKGNAFLRPEPQAAAKTDPAFSSSDRRS